MTGESTSKKSWLKDPRAIFFTLLILLVVNLNPNLYKRAPFCTPLHVDELLARYSDLNTDLRKDPLRAAGTLGYIADNEKKQTREIKSEKNQELDLESFRRFFIVQYALAPQMVLYEQSYPYIVGNFSSDQSGEIAAKQHHWLVTKRYGRGVFLFSTSASEVK